MNAGLAADPRWLPDLQHLMSRFPQATFMCTDYNEEAALRAVQCVRAAHLGTKALAGRPSPIRSNARIADDGAANAGVPG